MLGQLVADIVSLIKGGTSLVKSFAKKFGNAGSQIANTGSRVFSAEIKLAEEISAGSRVTVLFCAQWC